MGPLERTRDQCFIFLSLQESGNININQTRGSAFSVLDHYESWIVIFTHIYRYSEADSILLELL